MDQCSSNRSIFSCPRVSFAWTESHIVIVLLVIHTSCPGLMEGVDCTHSGRLISENANRLLPRTNIKSFLVSREVYREAGQVPQLFNRKVHLL